MLRSRARDVGALVSNRVLTILAEKVRVGDILECPDTVRRPVTNVVRVQIQVGPGVDLYTTAPMRWYYPCGTRVTVQRLGSKRATAEDVRDARSTLSSAYKLATPTIQGQMPLREFPSRKASSSLNLQLAAVAYTNARAPSFSRDTPEKTWDNLQRAALDYAVSVLLSTKVST